MTGRLAGKMALVTGGGKGIGQAIAERFAEQDATVIVADLDEAAGCACVERIVRSGRKAIFQAVDVADAGAVEALFAEVAADYGRLDVLVCSAAIYLRGDIVQTEQVDFDRLMRINVWGVYHACRAAIPLMRSGGGGSIINITSSAGWHSTAPQIFAYTTSKFAVTGLTKALAMDHLREGIRVNGIAPGPTDTPLLRASRPPEQFEAFRAAQPIGRLGNPEEIAAAATFLASDEASFVTGVILPVDGGQTTHL